MGAVRDSVIVLCRACGSEGFIERGHPNAPHADCVAVCTACDGAGVVEVRIDTDGEDAP